MFTDPSVWAGCDQCENWYHKFCLRPEEELKAETEDHWNCPQCLIELEETPCSVCMVHDPQQVNNVMQATQALSFFYKDYDMTMTIWYNKVSHFLALIFRNM